MEETEAAKHRVVEPGGQGRAVLVVTRLGGVAASVGAGGRTRAARGRRCRRVTDAQARRAGDVEKEERRRGGLGWEKEKENEPAGFGPGRDELFFFLLFFFPF